MPRVKARSSASAAASIGEVMLALWIDLVSFLADLDLLHFERGIAVFLSFLHSRLNFFHTACSIHTSRHSTFIA